MGFLFKLFISITVALYRWSNGKIGGSMGDFKVLLLTTTGRKSGKLFTTPLGYFPHPGGYVIVASNGGQAKHPAWYLNIKANPRVSVQISEQIFSTTAEVLNDEARSQAWQEVIRAAPQYAKYQQNTSRQIPLLLLRPNP